MRIWCFGSAPQFRNILTYSSMKLTSPNAHFIYQQLTTTFHSLLNLFPIHSPTGVSLLNVEKLNLLSLAPGGHVGRFCIWTESALGKLDALYGTWTAPSTMKSNYNLPQPVLNNADLTKLLHSQEVQVMSDVGCRMPVLKIL